MVSDMKAFTNKIRTFLCVLVTIICLMSSSIAYACMARISVEESFKKSDVVLLGEVVSNRTENDKNHITFSVRKIWKGTVKGTYQGEHRGFLSFQKGNRYQVYASYKDDSEILNIKTGGCDDGTDLALPWLSARLERFKHIHWKYIVDVFSPSYQEREWKTLGKPLKTYYRLNDFVHWFVFMGFIVLGVLVFIKRRMKINRL